MAETTSGGKETRLLIVTIVVSIVMLLVLARFRFPARPAPLTEPATPQPLERLAERATYDELTSILRGVDAHVSGSVVGVHVVAVDELAGGDARGLTTAAVRVPGDRAVALMRPGRHLERINATGVTLMADDERRGVALLGISGSSGSPPSLLDSSTTIAAPGYLAAIEATPAGLAVRPMYFGRVDRMTDPAWSDAVLRFSALQQALPEGAAIFTLRGEFVGLGTPDGRDLMVVPAALLLHAADTLATSGSQSLADVGFEVQSLDQALREATGAADGVVVAYVVPDGPAASALRVGDVVTGVGEAVVHSTDEFRVARLAMAVNQPVTIRFIRNGVASTTPITPVAARNPTPPAAGPQLGLGLRGLSGRGSQIIRVEAGSAAAGAGLMEGDVITTLDQTPHPRPDEILRAFQRLPSRQWLLVGIDRNGQHLVEAIGKP